MPDKSFSQYKWEKTSDPTINNILITHDPLFPQDIFYGYTNLSTIYYLTHAVTFKRSKMKDFLYCPKTIFIKQDIKYIYETVHEFQDCYEGINNT